MCATASALRRVQSGELHAGRPCRVVSRRVGRRVGRVVGRRVGRRLGRVVGRRVGRAVGRVVGIGAFHASVTSMGQPHIDVRIDLPIETAKRERGVLVS